MDKSEIPILNVICYVNPGKEYSTTWVPGCIRIHLQIVLSNNARSLVKNNTPYKDKGTPQWNS